MISGLKGAGVKDLTQYLMEQACIFLYICSIYPNDFSSSFRETTIFFGCTKARLPHLVG